MGIVRQRSNQNAKDFLIYSNQTVLLSLTRVPSKASDLGYSMWSDMQ